jgi:hypothetical protein
MMFRWFRFSLIVIAGLAILTIPVFFSDAPLSDQILTGTGFGIYAYLGGLIILRRDSHLTGWLLTLSGLAIVFADSFGRLPFVGNDLNSWVQSWAWAAVFAVFAAMTLTFPSGHPPRGPTISARLGRIALYALPILVAMAALTETMGGPESGTGKVNPIGFVPDSFSDPILLGVVAILFAGTISLVLKRRKATHAERAQLTWVVFALTIFVTLIVLTLLYVSIASAVSGDDPGDGAWSPVFLAMILFPLSFGVAILRYRLFDIDRIVSRTITYAIVAIILTGTYFGAVTLLGTLISDDDSSWQIAASTLVVAALFNPARRRVHGFVDRRFNRSQYDAQNVAAGLTEGIRDQIDPWVIGEAWTEAVAATMQPSAMALWLKDDAATKR